MALPATPYTLDEIHSALKLLSPWVVINEADVFIIKRHIPIENYQQGLDLVQHIGKLAEAQDHHPDMTLIYDELMVEIHTHASKGITQKDIDFAKATERLL